MGQRLVSYRGRGMGVEAVVLVVAGLKMGFRELSCYKLKQGNNRI